VIPSDLQTFQMGTICPRAIAEGESIIRRYVVFALRRARGVKPAFN
jgi:hypothetical protein